MRITILTLFPEMFHGPFDVSIIKKAVDKNLLTLSYINFRDFAFDERGSVDDHPYGGDTGMILRVDVVDKAISAAKKLDHPRGTRTVLLDPKGQRYTQNTAKHLRTISHLILVCGHYEGFDERVRNLVDETISVGDFILTGGELGAMIISDSVVRLLPGVLRNDETTENESFSYGGGERGNAGILEYPQYTKPQVYNGMSVPDILLSGNHRRIQEWRKNMAQKLTKQYRPDLLKQPKNAQKDQI